jgi:hypothetical protein
MMSKLTGMTAPGGYFCKSILQAMARNIGSPQNVMTQYSSHARFRFDSCAEQILLRLSQHYRHFSEVAPRVWRPLTRCRQRRAVRFDQWIGTVNPNENDGS